MTASLFLLLVENDQPQLVPLVDPDTHRIAGVNYWLIPVPSQPRHLGSAGDKHKKLMALAAAGRTDANALAREVGVAAATAERWMHEAGYETDHDRAARMIEEALAEAGSAGKSKDELNVLLRPIGSLALPILQVWAQKGKVRTLPDGNYVAVMTNGSDG